jgi:primosomal protein N' (replication factor Y)
LGVIAKIAVSAAVFAIDKPYSYRIPASLAVRAGMRVTVPFGKGNKKCEGIVLMTQEGDESRLKAVERALDDEPVLTDDQLRLAAFLRERYFCTYYDAVKAILPAGLWFETTETYTLCGEWNNLSIRQPAALQILQIIVEDFGGTADYHHLKEQLPDEARLEGGLRYLLGKKLLRSDLDAAGPRLRQDGEAGEPGRVLRRRGGIRPPQAEVRAAPDGRARAAFVRRQRLLPRDPLYDGRVHDDAQKARKARVRRDLRARGLPEPHRAPGGARRDAGADGRAAGRLRRPDGAGAGADARRRASLRRDRQRQDRRLRPRSSTKALAARAAPPCCSCPRSPSPRSCSAGMTAHFGKTVAVLHSSLRVGERFDEWRQASPEGEARVAVGTRSAVFAPRCRIARPSHPRRGAGAHL